MEINNLKKNNYKTGFMLEIDQKSSASVILSCVFGDIRIAEEANLMYKNENKDINNYIM